MAERHMRRVLGPGVDSAAQAMFTAYGRYWAEVLWARPDRVPDMVAQMVVDGVEHMRAARDAGRGVIYAVPHVGNWEVAGAISVREGIPLVAVAESLRNRRISAWFVEMRRSFGIEVVLAERSTEVMRALQAMIERGGAAALVCDRDLRGRGVKVDFFGERTTLPAGPVSLAVRTGAPVLPVACYFLDGPGHRLVVRPPLAIPSQGTREERVAAGTQVVAAALEELIRLAPTQWHLLQPNWPSDREPG
jgi:lauroyl/myristoyl acyltransferase